jgi:hypothetical protein
MQPTPTTIFGLALFACVLTRLPDKYKPTWAQRPCCSWQTLISLVAVIAAILIVMNPEFYALGILGDSAFFDFLVLAISLQMQAISTRVLRRLGTVLARNLRWVRIPSPGLSYLMTVSALAIGSVVSAIQKVAHRIFP